MVPSSSFYSRPLLIFTLSFALRLLFVLYGLWQDIAVKYTDIDYEVLTDGARFVSESGSPYLRSTYRYTPLLAYLLLPNIWWSRLWGKLLFLASDIIIGYLIVEILKFLFTRRRLYDNATETSAAAHYYALFWLFNPIAMNVSTRGNAESLVGALVLLSLYLVIVKRNLILGAIVYGFAIHFKIYPIVYSLALFLYVDSWTVTASKPQFSKWIFSTFTNPKRLLFAATTVFTLAVLTGIFYWSEGWTFLYETYLYHLVRKDNRHNFSVYFYPIYLAGSHESNVTNMAGNVLSISEKLSSVGLTLLDIGKDFGPQLALLLTITFAYYKDITFCVLLQTMTFVAFNKVCTVQYFCWYFSLLPLALPWNKRMPSGMAGGLAAAWGMGQGIWLWLAYRLEFLGENTFPELWIAGLIYFIVNVAIIMALAICHQDPDSVVLGNHSSPKGIHQNRESGDQPALKLGTPLQK